MKKILILILLLINSVGICQAQTPQPQSYVDVIPGKDYFAYNHPPFMAGPLDTKQIKIFYFYNFTDQLSYPMFKFLKQYQKPNSPIQIIFVPMYFVAYQVTSTRIALALNEAHLEDLQQTMYEAILNKKVDPDNLNQVADFVAQSQSYVTKDAFLRAYNGEVVKSDMAQVPMVIKSFGVKYFPAICLNGALYSDLSMAHGSQDRFQDIFLEMLKNYYNYIKQNQQGSTYK